MKRIIAALLAMLMVCTVFVACDSKDADKKESKQEISEVKDDKGTDTDEPDTEGTGKYENKVVFSASSVDVDSSVDYFDEARYKKLNEMFNFEIEFVPVAWDTWAERDRIWINSGDMPDIMFWDFNYNDYVKYTNQGLLKALPDDYQTKYPNLASVINRTGVEDFLKDVNDGELYIIPNVIYQTPVTEIPIDQYVAFYRKDWAEQLGFEIGETTTMDELCELADAMMKQDPGGNGDGKTIGITGAPPEMYHTFVRPFSTYYDKVYNNGTEYTYGALDDGTLDGILNMKEIYDSGVVDRDFYTVKGIEYRDKFYAGKAGIMLSGCSVSHYAVEFSAQFKEANPDLDPFECMGITAVTDNDGTYHAVNSMNFWASSIFSADMDDEAMDRALAILDYIATEEGQYLVYLGVEGEDYTMDGDEYVMELDSSGNAPNSQMKNYYWTKPILPDDWALHDPTINDDARQVVLDVFKAKEKDMSVTMIDYDYTFLSSPEKSNSTIEGDTTDAITQVLLSQGDIAEEWNKWKESVMPKVEPVLSEVNSELLGK